MKLFTKNTFRNLALSALSAAVLSACGGAGSCATCTTPTPGSLTLSIAAPSQYPAGLATPIEASLTMTNTSSVDANNLVYNIPLPNQTGNYTGVVITPNAGIGSPSGACTNILAGASCTFSATIAAYANPGSFTVTATPNGSTSSTTKATQAGKSLQAGDSISVTANLGLVDVPNTNNEYYILPSEQTVQGSTVKPSEVYVSVWVKKAGEGLNSLKLVDDAGVELDYEPVGTPSYAVNSVNSYKVTIPAGKTIQHIQAFGYNGSTPVCNILNNGENNNTACSNDADVNLAQSGVGILAIQPNYFQMSESRESQVVTLQNVGTANITAMQMPVIAAPFSVLANTCTGITSLKPADSCSVTIGYTAGSSSGQGSYVVNYNNGTQGVNTAATILYIGKSNNPFAILTLSPSSFSLSESLPLQRITVQNTGTAAATGLVLPTLTLPLQESTTTTCVASGSLAIGDSCYYDVYINYAQSQTAGSESITFTYNNGQQSQTVSAASDWGNWKFWTLITGGVGQPPHVRDVYGSPTPQSIIVSADNAPISYAKYLWVYNNGSWSQLCNGENGTPGAGRVLMNTSPTSNNILWSTDSDELWGYTNGSWSKILEANSSGDAPAGSGFGGVTDNSDISFIVGSDINNQLWMYNNNAWVKLTGGLNQPSNVYMLSKGGAQPNAITIYADTGDIWFYNGTAWAKIGNAATDNPPNPNAATTGGTFYGVSTANSILYTASLPDYTHPLWVYGGSSWIQYNGSNLSGTPVDVGTIFGTPSNSSLISRDGHLANEANWDNYSIWTYVNGTWTNMTTGDGSSAPQYGWLVFGANAVPDHFFMSDLQGSANLWEWYGNSWTKKTGATGGPQYVGFVAGNPTHNSFVMNDNNSQLWTYVNGSWANITSHTDEPASVDGIYGLVNPDSIVATHYVGKLAGSDLWIGKR